MIYLKTDLLLHNIDTITVYGLYWLMLNRCYKFSLAYFMIYIYIYIYLYNEPCTDFMIHEI